MDAEQVVVDSFSHEEMSTAVAVAAEMKKQFKLLPQATGSTSSLSPSEDSEQQQQRHVSPPATLSSSSSSSSGAECSHCPSSALVFSMGVLFFLMGVFGLVGILRANLAVERFHGNFFIPSCVYASLIVPEVVATFGIGRSMKLETAAKARKGMAS